MKTRTAVLGALFLALGFAAGYLTGSPIHRSGGDIRELEVEYPIPPNPKGNSRDAVRLRVWRVWDAAGKQDVGGGPGFRIWKVKLGDTTYFASPAGE